MAQGPEFFPGLVAFHADRFTIFRGSDRDRIFKSKGPSTSGDPVTSVTSAKWTLTRTLRNLNQDHSSSAPTILTQSPQVMTPTWIQHKSKKR
eukprot:2168888-Rhodomonas_salina.1